MPRLIFGAILLIALFLFFRELKRIWLRSRAEDRRKDAESGIGTIDAEEDAVLTEQDLKKRRQELTELEKTEKEK